VERILHGEDIYGLDASLRGVLAPGALAWRALRSRGPAPATIDDTEILVLYLPSRRDYAELLGPPTAELVRRGRRVRVVVPGRRGRPDAAFGGAEVLPLERFGSAGAYRAARRALRELEPELRRFANDFGLTPQQRRQLGLCMQAYAWERELFTAALARTGAEAVFGLHFTLNPGLLGAVAARRRASGRPLPVALLQHGVFSHGWADHDFHGADLVLTWGTYFDRELAAFQGATPAARAVGNPRFERLAAGRAERPPRDRPRVLYIGTNGEEAADRAAFELVAEALAPQAGLEVLFRPHPDEPREKYAALVAAGTIRADAIRDGGRAHDLLGEVDLVVGTQSTLLLEGIAMGVPGIQVLPERFEVDWARRGLPAVSDAAGLRELVAAFLHEPEAGLAAAGPLVRDMFGGTGAASTAAAAAAAGAAAGALEDLLDGARRGVLAA